MRAWSAAAEDKLRRLYPVTDSATLAFQLKRTPKAIRSRAKVLGIRKANPRRRWTSREDAQLRRRYPCEQTATIARDLGRTETTTYQRAYALGLHKSAAFLASPASGRTNGRQGMGTRFVKGVPSWSKGTKGRVGVQEGCRRTQFKKGCMAGAAQHNYVPVGTERINADGYLERKVTDDHPVPARRWVGVHRLAWEAAHGPIPAGYSVAFLPNRRTTEAERITPDGLELVTRAELMRRNSFRTRYPELAPLIQLRGALNRKINRRTRAAETAE